MSGFRKDPRDYHRKLYQYRDPRDLKNAVGMMKRHRKGSRRGVVSQQCASIIGCVSFRVAEPEIGSPKDKTQKELMRAQNKNKRKRAEREWQLSFCKPMDGELLGMEERRGGKRELASS